MTRFIEGEVGSFDPAKQFERSYLKYAGEPPLNDRGNSKRFFIASTGPYSRFTSVNRAFYIPFRRGFEPRTSISIILPNTDFNTPDKFARGEIDYVSQSDEHRGIVDLSKTDQTSHTIVCSLNSDNPEINTKLEMRTEYDQAGAGLVFVETFDYDDDSPSSLEVNLQNPLSRLSQGPLVIAVGPSPLMCRFSLSNDGRSIIAFAHERGVNFKITLPVHFNLQQTVERLIREGRLDENLLYHALDEYGQWDESFNRIDWASEVGVEATILGKTDWNTLMKGI